MIQFGDKVADAITGFTGIAVRKTIWLYGCKHIGIVSTELDMEGLPDLVQSFDEQRVTVLEVGAIPFTVPEIEVDGDGNPVIDPTKIVNGNRARDTITGFTGVVIGTSLRMFGTTNFAIQPEGLKDGKPIDSVWFEEGRLEKLDDAEPSISKDNTASSGGPATAPRYRG